MFELILSGIVFILALALIGETMARHNLQSKVASMHDKLTELTYTLRRLGEDPNIQQKIAETQGDEFPGGSLARYVGERVVVCRFDEEDDPFEVAVVEISSGGRYAKLKYRDSEGDYTTRWRPSEGFYEVLESVGPIPTLTKVHGT